MSLSKFKLVKTINIDYTTISIYRSTATGVVYFTDGIYHYKRRINRDSYICIYHNLNSPPNHIPGHVVTTFTKASKRFNQMVEILQSNKTQILINGTF